MNLKAIATSLGRRAGTALVEHIPEVTLGLGIVGFGATVVTACKATPKALKLRADRDIDVDETGEICESKPVMLLRDARAMAPAYLPAILLGAATVTMFVAGNRVQAKRGAVLAAAYSLSERALRDYQQAVVDHVGEEAHAAIMEESGMAKLAKAQDDCPFDDGFVVGGNGDTLCYDAVTGLYFRSSVEKIQAAEGRVSKLLIDEARVPLSELYCELGLPCEFRLGDAVGWDVSRDAPNIYFTSMLDREKRPCLVLNYNVSLLDRGAFR